jgi:hypothetical protein
MVADSVVNEARAVGFLRKRRKIIHSLFCVSSELPYLCRLICIFLNYSQSIHYEQTSWQSVVGIASSHGQHGFLRHHPRDVGTICRLTQGLEERGAEDSDLQCDETHQHPRLRQWFKRYVVGLLVYRPHRRDQRVHQPLQQFQSSTFTSHNGSAVSGMNIEHSFPKSWWGGSENEAYRDLYNLYPSDSKANSAKGNYAMGVVTTVKSTAGEGYDKVGTGSVPGIRHHQSLGTRRCL